MTIWSRSVKRVANIVINLYMENREQQILSEIKALMSSVRMQLEQLDVKMAELQQIYDPQSVEVEEIDLGFDMPEVAFAAAGVAVQAVSNMVEGVEEESVEPVADEPVEDNQQETVSADEIPEEQPEDDVDDLPFFDTPESEEIVVDEAEETDEADVDEAEEAEETDADVADSEVEETEEDDTLEVEETESKIEETESEVEVLQDIDDLPELVSDDEVEESAQQQDMPEEEDLPLFALEEDAPVTLLETAIAASPKSAVIDVMTAKQAWRTDMPGSPVKDIRAAIALVDRALFINKLFAEDAAAFMETINAVNQMSTLDEAVEYLASVHPSWNFESDIVYRFMMAIRRKVN